MAERTFRRRMLDATNSSSISAPQRSPEPPPSRPPPAPQLINKGTLLQRKRCTNSSWAHYSPAMLLFNQQHMNGLHRKSTKQNGQDGAFRSYSQVRLVGSRPSAVGSRLALPDGR